MVMLERDGRLIDTTEHDMTTSEEQYTRSQGTDSTPHYTFLDRLVFAALDHIAGSDSPPF